MALYQPGQSGNPSGRPAKESALTKRCQKMLPEIMETLQAIITCVGEKTADRLTAMELVLAYGFGKPKQRQEFSGADGNPLQVAAAVVGQVHVYLPDNGRGDLSPGVKRLPYPKSDFC